MKLVALNGFKSLHGKAVSISSKKQSNKMAHFIKYFSDANASAIMYSKLVFIVADAQLTASQFDVFMVKGFSTYTATFGCLCFTKNRGGNSKFLSWLTTTILPQFVRDIRTDEDIDDQLPFCINCDGEQIQIQHTLMRKLSKFS